MLVQTHFQFADYLYEKISEYVPFDLNKKYFTLGNMEPDFPLIYAGIKHYKEKNFDFVLNLIDNLQNEQVVLSTPSIRNFSEKLGTINHFLCDYFCKPHVDRAYYSSHLKEHLVYEKLLHKHVINEKYSLTSFDLEPIEDFSSVKSYINTLIDMYLDKKDSFDKDISFALSACVALNFSIIQNTVIVPAVLSYKTL